MSGGGSFLFGGSCLQGAYFQLCHLAVDPWAIYMTSLSRGFPIGKKKLMTHHDLTGWQE